MNKPTALALLLWFSSLYSVVIVVHGTFATEELWHCPTGDFYKKLEEEALLLGEKVMPFSWSGKLNHKARLQAAESLAHVILEYAHQKITLIGHSHGGNVINLASQLLAQEPALQEELFVKMHKNIIPQHKSLPIEKEYLIDYVYFLATPIDTKCYPPNMKVIKHLCNFYSKKDWIQSVFGLYKRRITNAERVVNLQVIIHHDTIKKHPSHGQMHHPLIAQWILSIPFRLIDDKVTGFEQFSWMHDGTVYFDTYNKPYYQPAKKLIADINSESKQLPIASLV